MYFSGCDFQRSGPFFIHPAPLTPIIAKFFDFVKRKLLIFMKSKEMEIPPVPVLIQRPARTPF